METPSYMPPEGNEIHARLFVLTMLSFTVCTVAVAAGMSRYLYMRDIAYTDNDVIRQHHFDRLNGERTIETLVVGDSSAGNAIDGEELGVMLGSETYNAALTGGFGPEGSYNMIRQALRHGHPITTVIIVQTTDVWHRPFAEQGLIESGSGLSLADANRVFPEGVSPIPFQFNPKELWWYAKHILLPDPLPVIENGYLPQRSETYHRGTRVVFPNEKIKEGITPAKRAALILIDELCVEHALTCVYLHGPLHEEVARRSAEVVSAINETIVKAAPHVILIPDLLMLPNEKMGDSIDHVDLSAKSESTRWYAKRILGAISRQ